MTHSPLPNAPSTDRRRLLQMSILGSLAALVPTAAARAQEAAAPPPPGDQFISFQPRPLPVVDARFPAEMAPGVFVLPDKRIPLNPNIGIIVGRETVLVVDCGMGIESAENILELTRRLAPRRGIVLTVTHAHPEHGFGAQVFKPDGRIWYNRAQPSISLDPAQRCSRVSEPGCSRRDRGICSTASSSLLPTRPMTVPGHRSTLGVGRWNSEPGGRPTPPATRSFISPPSASSSPATCSKNECSRSSRSSRP